MEKIRVEIFYGTEEDNEEFGLVYFFENYNEAIDFVNFTKEHSNCNAKLISLFIFNKE